MNASAFFRLSIATLLIATTAVSPLRAEPLAAGVAQGTVSNQGAKPLPLAFASTFVDQKDERKPTVLILSDLKLPTEKWTSEFDLMRATGKNPFSGAVFFLNAGEVYRTDFYWQGRQSGVSGYFTLKLDAAAGKALTGTVTSTGDDAAKPKVDAKFHATLK